MGTEQSHDDPGPQFQVLLSKLCSIAASGGRLESEGWTHQEKLTFQSGLCSVLGKGLDVCIFSHIQSSLQHCEMNASITTVLRSK